MSAHAEETSAEVDTTVWDGSVAESFESGDGTGKDPYLIATASQLAYFAQCVNNGEGFKDKRIELRADIDLAKLPWTPIGTAENSFKGFFLGRGHIVSGLNYQNAEADYAGLFGYIENAYISNVILVDSYVSVREGAGGIVGKSIYGSIENCRSYATLSANNIAGGIVAYNYGGDVEKCINFGLVSGNNAGGIVGFNALSEDGDSLVASCRNVGNIVGGSNVGGIIGGDFGESKIYNCINTKYIAATRYVGGIVGYKAKGSVSSCRNVADILSTDSESFCGGIAGLCGGETKNNYNTGRINGEKYVGGIVGSGKDGRIESCYSVGVAIGREFVGAVVGERGRSVSNCYYLVSGSADLNGKSLRGIGNTEKDSAEVRGLGFQIARDAESYRGFDFSVWTIEGSLDYNYPEIITHADIDAAYVREYGTGDPLRDIEPFFPNGQDDQSAHKSVPVWIWIGGAAFFVALFVILFIKARSK